MLQCLHSLYRSYLPVWSSQPFFQHWLHHWILILSILSLITLVYYLLFCILAIFKDLFTQYFTVFLQSSIGFSHILVFFSEFFKVFSGPVTCMAWPHSTMEAWTSDMHGRAIVHNWPQTSNNKQWITWNVIAYNLMAHKQVLFIKLVFIMTATLVQCQLFGCIQESLTYPIYSS